MTQPMADINDVYAWMTSNGEKISLAMTVSPFDDGSRNFGPSVQYAFHLTRYHFEVLSDFPATPQQIGAGEQSKIICTFASNTDGQCWLVDPTNKVLEYVKGDFSATAGKTSPDGKLKVFAGRRADPFFFNFAGFLTAQKKIEFACGGGTQAAACPGALATVPNFLDAAGCPQGLTFAQTSAVVQDLSEAQAGPSQTDPTSTLGPCPANQKDCFAGRNVMAIVVEVDKTLITNDDTKPLLSVYGSTHAAP